PTTAVPEGPPTANGAAVAAAPATRPARPPAPAEDANQWLNRRLAESGGAGAADLPARAAQPVRPPRDAPVPVPVRPWLPPPAVAAAPRAARADRDHAVRPRPAVEAQPPPLALDVTPDVPGPVVLPAYTPPRIASPDPSKVPL